jgi:MFS family permease
VFLLASAGGSLMLSRMSFTRPIDGRYQIVVRASVIGLVPLSLVDTRAGLAAAAVIAGLAVAAKVPTAIALAARLTPAEQHAETMGWLISASWVGVAVGAAIAGVVGDAWGPRAALTGVPVSAAVAAGFLFLCRHRLAADVAAADAAGYSRCSSPTTGESVKPPTLRTASNTPGMKETRSIVS